MGVFVDRVRVGGGRVLWLDYVDYAGRLLAAGNVPWLEPASCAAWLRKAQGLLRSDVCALPLERVAAAWLLANPGVCEAMGARSRTVYPIKVLLGEEALRAHLVALYGALRASVPGPVFALSLPSPRAWVQQCYRLAHDSDAEVGEDEADSASLYIADLLRDFGESGVDAIELVETTATEPATAADLACYQSVLNVAGHYRWDCGLRVAGLRYDGQGSSLDFIVSPGSVAGPLHGRVLGPEFWDGLDAPGAAGGTFRYSAVPAECNPERVLERLTTLR